MARLLLTALLLAAHPLAGLGQEGPFTPPTLADLGFRYASPGGFFEIVLSGRLDLEGYVPADDPAWIIPDTRSFSAGRVSVFSDLFVGRHLYGLAEIRADRGEAPTDQAVQVRVEQAFLRYQPWLGRAVHVQAGVFVSPFGGYAQRHHSTADPFIRPPLFHEHPTMVSARLLPRGNDGFIDWKLRPAFFRPVGTPIVWGIPYQAGVMIFGSLSRLHARAALMNSAPSSEPSEWGLDLQQRRKFSSVLHLDYEWTAELRTGISYNQGPYLEESAVSSAANAAISINGYDQKTLGFEATFARGRTEIRSELLLDWWEVPRVDDVPRETAYYAEGKLKLIPGLYAALRYGAIDFNRIARSDGTLEPWDYDVRRWQLGAGYQFGRNTGVQAEYAITRTSGPVDPRDNLASLRLWWEF
ncbi:MAG: hypothetical protein HY701_06600 [Gemmatimonadetes bacterium]|nr:hypothetical protein [Gemmatimonadota bacterium]